MDKFNCQTHTQQKLPLLSHVTESHITYSHFAAAHSEECLLKLAVADSALSPWLLLVQSILLCHQSQQGARFLFAGEKEQLD